ncbi:MAG TPA: PepSY-associated TM helix domain-containing protein [Roseomonas sp.]|jgi:uncharacterized iron-regulated membrane protein
MAATATGPARVKAQRVWRFTHRWIGLVAGTVMALIGLTGSATVFQREIDAWLNPALFTPGDGPARHGAADALAAAQALDRGRVSIIRLPDPVWPVLTVNQTRHGPNGPERWMVHVDPVSGRVLGARNFEASFTQTIYLLHSTLLLRRWWGKEIAGIAGLLALFSIGSGLYLWWPRQDGAKALLRLRRRPRQILYLDLHNLAGAWASILLLVIATAGVWLALPGIVRPVVNLVTETRQRPPSSPERFASSPAIDADRAQALAEAAIPGAAAGYLSPPTQQRNAWQVGLHGIGGDPRLRSRSLVWIDPASGAVLRQLGEGQGPLGARMEKDLIWLHSGALFGLGGRLLAVLAGLSLPVLWTTGLLFWLRRRRLRQATPRPAMAPAA